MGWEDIVASGYDRVAEQYLGRKDAADPVLIGSLEELARSAPPGCAALDLGCGAGVPVTRWLAERYVVTGVDVSARQLQLACEHVPTARLLQASMTTIDFPPESFDVVVAFHSIIHISRAEQPALVRRIHGWLRSGGRFLATWSVNAWEGVEDNWQGWGAPMWWSHHDAATNLQMLEDGGFGVESAVTRSSGGETWLWVMARA